MHVLDGNVPEVDNYSPTDIEANLSTEVALTILDVLGLFVQNHKVRLATMLLLFQSKKMHKIYVWGGKWNANSICQ